MEKGHERYRWPHQPGWRIHRAAVIAAMDIKDVKVSYSLNAVGVRIWNLIQEPRTMNEVRDILLQKYEVEPDRCECDLLALLEGLATEGLIEIKDEIAG